MTFLWQSSNHILSHMDFNDAFATQVKEIILKTWCGLLLHRRVIMMLFITFQAPIMKVALPWQPLDQEVYWIVMDLLMQQVILPIYISILLNGYPGVEIASPWEISPSLFYGSSIGVELLNYPSGVNGSWSFIELEYNSYLQLHRW